MKRSRILVVDNHENVREVMSNLLELLDVEAVPCAGGEEVLQRLSVGEYDGVISDVVMPEMGGLDLAARLQREKPDLPIIMMSSYASVALEEEVRSKGAVGLMAKPFKLESVTRLLKAAGVPFVHPS
jgi:CheY-like chemotaxis protein